MAFGAPWFSITSILRKGSSNNDNMLSITAHTFGMSIVNDLALLLQLTESWIKIISFIVPQIVSIIIMCHSNLKP